jgi:hypothetical protein
MAIAPFRGYSRTLADSLGENMKSHAIAAIAAAGIILSGCATIIEGTTQPVSLNTTPEQGAQCTLTN